MKFESIGLMLPLSAAAGAFFPRCLRFSFSATLNNDLFSSTTASHEVPWASCAVHDLKRQKLVSAFQGDLQQINSVRAMSEAVFDGKKHCSTSPKMKHVTNIAEKSACGRRQRQRKPNALNVHQKYGDESACGRRQRQRKPNALEGQK